MDYPSTWQQFQSWFPDDASCVAYLERLRWPDGFVCPMCASERGWRIAQRDMWMCVSCGRKTSVTAGTIFHRSRLPISSWFAAAWFICAQKNGVSALGLQRVLGLGSYETAWSWLHKFRRAMVRPERDKLDGLVEVDETYFGARDQGKDGRGTGKSPIVIAVEMRSNPKRLGRVRLAHIPALSAESLCAFVNDSVAKGVTVRTDGWNVYQRLGAQGYRHTPINVAPSGDPAHIAMPGVHRVAALLKRWLTGTLRVLRRLPKPHRRRPRRRDTGGPEETELATAHRGLADQRNATAAERSCSTDPTSTTKPSKRSPAPPSSCGWCWTKAGRSAATR